MKQALEKKGNRSRTPDHSSSVEFKSIFLILKCCTRTLLVWLAVFLGFP